MVDLTIQKMKQDLRARLGRFVAADSRRHYPYLYSVLEGIRCSNFPAFLCGGAVRNMLLCNGSIPRDLDIILGYVSREQLVTLFPDHIKGETSLGGLKLQVRDWSIDVWPIQDTWAFREGKVAGKGFSDYPKTTFLNIDAVAIQLFSKRRQKREIYSKGFFEGIAERIIEINFPENPTPAECLVRALWMANKFDFAIGPRLARYMISYTNQMGISELAERYQRRYVSMDISVERLHSCFKHIETQMRVSDRRPVRVFAEQNSNSIDQRPDLPTRNPALFSVT